MTDWIKLDTTEPEPESTWVRSIGWDNKVLIVRIYEDDDQRIMRYEDVPRSVFDEIQEAYNRGDSVGSKLNELVIRNPDMPKAQPFDSESN